MRRKKFFQRLAASRKISVKLEKSIFTGGIGIRRVRCVFRDKCDIAFLVGIIFSVNPEATFSVVKYHKQIDIHMTPVVTPSAFFNDLSGHAEIGQMLKIIQQHSSSERQLAKEKCEFHTYGRFSVIIHLF